jgi:prepilin-type N-terminal cleavage/methylation domain-containing protein
MRPVLLAQPGTVPQRHRFAYRDPCGQETPFAANGVSVPFRKRAAQRGLTLVELLIALAVAAVLIAGLAGVLGEVAATHDVVRDKSDLTRQARFAMQRMVQAVGSSRLLLLPLNDVAATNWPENIREQTVPPTPPIGDSTRATAVLSVTLPEYQDLDGDGFADADDDKDGRIDEDLGDDRNNDAASGIYLIDDDGDGAVDEGSSASDDDEIGTLANEDRIDGIDNDGDNNIDEDPGNDNNGDGCSGRCGVDDDGDGAIDEGAAGDDDEDGSEAEDWYNPVVFYLDNGTLMERTPVPWDANASGGRTGQDFIVKPIAEDVTRFRVERLPFGGGPYAVVDLTLELTSPVTGEAVSLNTRVRVGGGL